MFVLSTKAIEIINILKFILGWFLFWHNIAVLLVRVRSLAALPHVMEPRDHLQAGLYGGTIRG